MVAGGEIKLSGFKELSDILKDMPDKLAKNALKKASAAGIKVVRDKAASNIGRRVSDFAMSTRFKYGHAMSVVGFNVKKIKEGVYQNISMVFRELGAKPHRIGKGGKTGGMHPGMKARPFLGPAFDSTKEQVLDVCKDVLGQQIDEVWKK